jgi:hypothetical protein
MSDQTSAGIFGSIFEYIAKWLPPGEDREEFAEWLWDQSKGYDFSAEDLDCENQLIKLGLAQKQKGVEPGDRVIVYRDDPGFKKQTYVVESRRRR